MGEGERSIPDGALSHHWASRKRLNAYLNEMTWRFSLRAIGEGARVNALLSRVEGWLKYKALIA